MCLLNCITKEKKGVKNYILFFKEGAVSQGSCTFFSIFNTTETNGCTSVNGICHKDVFAVFIIAIGLRKVFTIFGSVVRSTTDNGYDVCVRKRNSICITVGTNLHGYADLGIHPSTARRYLQGHKHQMEIFRKDRRQHQQVGDQDRVFHGLHRLQLPCFYPTRYPKDKFCIRHHIEQHIATPIHVEDYE